MEVEPALLLLEVALRITGCGTKLDKEWCVNPDGRFCGTNACSSEPGLMNKHLQTALLQQQEFLLQL